MIDDRRIPNRLPKGTKRDDYEPEVLAAFDRKRWRRVKAGVRKRKRHAGVADVLLTLDKDARDTLDRLCKEHGLSKSQVITQLLKEHTHVQVPKESPAA